MMPRDVLPAFLFLLCMNFILAPSAAADCYNNTGCYDGLAVNHQPLRDVIQASGASSDESVNLLLIGWIIACTVLPISAFICFIMYVIRVNEQRSQPIILSNCGFMSQSFPPPVFIFPLDPVDSKYKPLNSRKPPCYEGV
jgi:hypothetical protein